MGPAWEDPGFEDPGFEDPGVEDPGVEDPGFEDPGVEDPGVESQPDSGRPRREALRRAAFSGQGLRGEAIRVVMTKWGDRPHWAFDGLFLGEDRHGSWVGFRAGTRFARPGSEFVASDDHVTLAPVTGGFLATFWPDGGPESVYVDVSTPPTWDGAVLRAVDLDLDVVRRRDGSVLVDDEDEFAEHRVTFGYPGVVVAQARATCDHLLAVVRQGEAPFDHATPAAWLATLRALPPG